jgi:hypothetical protein
MAGLNDLSMVNTRPRSRLDANAPVLGQAGPGVGGVEAETQAGAAAATAPQVSNFVTVQSLGTFAVAVPVLKTIWELMEAVFGSWAESYWVPFAICLVYASWQLGISVSGATGAKTPMERFSAAVIGAANGAVVAAAVIGLTETTV